MIQSCRVQPIQKWKTDSLSTTVESLHPLIKFSHNTGGSSSGSSSSGRNHANDNITARSNASRGRDPINGLQAALQEGYILPLESDEFKWSHDRYSQAAMELANPTSREKIHLKIARYLLEEETVNNFLVADHLLKCLPLLKDADNKSCFKEVLYEAG